jgi:hypothetical protein
MVISFSFDSESKWVPDHPARSMSAVIDLPFPLVYLKSIFLLMF